MIFENAGHITNKNAFVELITIYIRIVEVTAQKYNKCIVEYPTPDSCIFSELKDMGIIDAVTQIDILRKILGDRFLHFISCIHFYLKHKDYFDDTIKKLSNKSRKLLQDKETHSNKPTFVDFFAGAGGLSCGFTEAGFRVVFANDFEDVCVRTYRFNHPELLATNVLKGDIRNIVVNIGEYVSTPVDIVVGGPPCQGFSSANQQRIIDDPRNELYKYFIKAVKSILPKFVVMENVKGMLSVANQVIEDYQNIDEIREGKHYSYKAGYKLLNSVDFSVAQNRERLIYIAIRADVAADKQINPEDIFQQIQDNNLGNKVYTLRDALDYIKPLDAPRIKNMNEVDDPRTGKKIDISEFNGNESSYLRLINGDRKILYLFNHKARFVNNVNYEIYRLLNQGDDASDPKIEDIMPYTNRLHCFKDKYYKLIADRPSRTITAHLRMDCHSHIHPFQIRALTPREAARCQSFPDDYLFLGAYLKTYMQIGNAVPCVMAKGIANVIKKYI